MKKAFRIISTMVKTVEAAELAGLLVIAVVSLF